MTAEEIQTVKSLRQNGLGYKKIASITGVNMNTVKAYCKRHQIENTCSAPEGRAFCRGCGKPYNGPLVKTTN